MAMTQSLKKLVVLRLQLTTVPGYKTRLPAYGIVLAGAELCEFLPGDRHAEVYDLVHDAIMHIMDG